MPGLFPKIKKPLVIAATTVAVFFFLSGCSVIDGVSSSISERFSSQDEQDAAVEVVDTFFEFIMEKDFSQAYMLISEEDRQNRDIGDFTGEFADVTDIVKVEINWVEVKSNIATVGIDLMDSYDGQEKMYKDIEVSLIKEEDGSWKIVFWD